MRALFFSVLFVILSTSAFANELKVGSEAPKVSGTSEAGQPLQLEELYKKGKVLLFFYPKAHTSGCTAQACSLRDAYEKLKSQGVEVVGVSTDKVDDQLSFKKKNRLPYPLISDPDKKVISAFGVKTFMNFSSRQAFLVVDGKIAWFDREASTDKQAEDVLEVLKKLKN